MTPSQSPCVPILALGLGVSMAACSSDAPPTVPSDPNLGSASTTSMQLTWTASADDIGVTGYDVYRDGVLVGSVATPPWLDTGLRAGSRYCYVIVAVDGAGRESDESDEVCGFTLWNREEVDTTGYVNGQDQWGFVSLAVDTANRLHLGYVNLTPTGRSARYARRAAGSWSTSIFGGAPNAYDWTTVAATSTGDATLCYATSGWMLPTELVCRPDLPGGNTVETVELGTFTAASLAFDSNDAGHVAYYDVGAADLVVATDASGSWVATRVDTAGDVGSHAALAIGPDDAVHVAYHDAAGDLKYATDASGSWVVSTIDASGFVGEYPDIAVDDLGHAHVSYHDTANGDLKYATNASGSWQVTVVDALGEVGLWSSIAVDASRIPHVAYFDATHFDLVYASIFDGAWVRTIVEDGGAVEVGRYAALVIDSAGVVSIAYDAGPDLVVANNR